MDPKRINHGILSQSSAYISRHKMYSYHQKPLCVLFISFAAVIYFCSLNKNSNNEKFRIANKAPSTINRLTDSNVSDTNKDPMEKIPPEFNNDEVFDVLRILETTDNSTRLKDSTLESQYKKTKIYILGLFELTNNGEERVEGLHELEAAEKAVEHVNSLNVLPGYELVLLVNDTNCDPGVALDRIFHAIYTQPTIIMLLGAGCSNVSETLAHVVPYWNILQANNFITELERENISCIASITFSIENYREQLKILRGFDARIIIGSFSEDMTWQIFCAAYDLNMFADEYIWILQNGEINWWNSSISDCHSRNIIESLNGVFTTSDYDYFNHHNLESTKRTQVYSGSKNLSKYVWQTYDAVWSIALTLKESSVDYLENFHYGRNDMACDFFKKMMQLAFIGLSGPIKFNGPDRIGDLVINQIQNGELKPIAFFDSLRNRLDLRCSFCHRVAWRNSEQIPVAQRILKMRLIKISKEMYGTISLITLLGISLALAFLYFNLKYRRMKTLKISSPKLNSVAIVGCILVYVSVILHRITDAIQDTQIFFDEICSLRAFLLSAGFCLTFGSIFAKCYRVHRLLVGSTASLVRNRLLKDNHMIALILVPLLVDAIIMALWVNIDPLQKHLYNLVLEINAGDRRIAYQPQVEVCLCRNTVGWYVALFGYKGLIVTMGVYMAWKTRSIKVSVLNDSQHIGICVYSVVFCTIIVVFFSLLKEYVIVSYLARNLSILMATTVALILLFLTKIKSIFNKVDTEECLMQSLGLKIEYRTRRFLVDDPRELIHRLEIQNRVHTTRLENLQKEISHLENLFASQSLPITFNETKSTNFVSNIHLLNVSDVNIRASWPNAESHAIKAFCSEDRLASGKLKFFARLRHLFGSIRSLENNSSRYVTEELDRNARMKHTKREFGSITF